MPAVQVRRWWVGAVVVACALGASPAAAGSEAPAGLISGRPHVVRFRPELLTLPRAPARLTGRERAAGATAVASCDPAQVAARGKVPTTPRAHDASAACVVLPVGSTRRTVTRLLLGPAELAGDAIREVEARHKAVGDEVVVRLTTKATELVAPEAAEQLETADFAPPRWRVDVDGVVVGTVVGGRAPALAPSIGARLIISGAAIHDDATDSIADAIDQARSEQLVDVAGQATMTRLARELLAQTKARVDDKSQFALDCPSPEAQGTLVLGCYDGEIFVLRVERADLAPVMTVTAAHEVLHAAFDELSRAQRRRVVDELDAFMASTGDARIEALLAEYDVLQPGTRDNEMHSLVGTRVRDLPAPLERHYRSYFTNRSAIIDAFDAYQKVFDNLKNSYDTLEAEVQALEGEINGLQAEIAAASGEADQLAGQIDELRAQGRIDESNLLVEQQNAAASRANNLIATVNVRIDDYNAKIDELNALALSLNETYNEISPIPVELPPG